MSVPAGWYPDPNGSIRWWDGYRWTETVQPSAPTAVPARVPEGTATSTVWIWVIALLPLIGGTATIAYVAWVQETMLRMVSAMPYVASSPDRLFAQQMTFAFSPWVVVMTLVSWGLIGVTIWFAYLDRRQLLRLGYHKTFHWAWAFLGSLVYVIGRGVIVRRQTGRGLAPMWTAIGVQAVLLIAMIGWMIHFMSVFFTAIFQMADAFS